MFRLSQLPSDMLTCVTGMRTALTIHRSSTLRDSHTNRGTAWNSPIAAFVLHGVQLQVPLRRKAERITRQPQRRFTAKHPQSRQGIKIYKASRAPNSTRGRTIQRNTTRPQLNTNMLRGEDDRTRTGQELEQLLLMRRGGFGMRSTKPLDGGCVADGHRLGRKIKRRSGTTRCPQGQQVLPDVAAATAPCSVPATRRATRRGPSGPLD